MKRMIGWTISLILLTACAGTPERRTVDIGTETPQQWQSLQLDAIQADSSWWPEFQDEKLSSILNEALLRNYDLQIAAANLQSAAAQAKITGAPLYPQLSAAANGARRKQNFIGLPIPGSEGSVLTNLSNTFGVSLDMSWEIDLWGRIRSEHRAALANMQAARADLEGARLSLAAQVSKSWFAAVEAQRQVTLAKATVENRRLSHQRVSERYESGLTPSLDYRLSLSSLASSEAIFSQRQAQFDATVRQLEILLGRYPSAALELSPALPTLPAAIPAGIPADILARRPDLIAAERRWLAADANVSSAKRALYPRISLTGSTGTSTDELKEILNGDFSIWSIAGNILQPLFQGGRLRANVKLNKSQAEIARFRYIQTILRAFGEVESTLAREGFLQDREAALQTATEQAVAARDLAAEQYASGLSDFLSLLDAQRTAFDTESQLLSVQRERLDARIDLHLALGGGFAQETK